MSWGHGDDGAEPGAGEQTAGGGRAVHPPPAPRVRPLHPCRCPQPPSVSPHTRGVAGGRGTDAQKGLCPSNGVSGTVPLERAFSS